MTETGGVNGISEDESKNMDGRIGAALEAWATERFEALEHFYDQS